MPSGSLVGIYYGEALSEREYLVRHASTTAELARLRSLSRGPYDAVIDRATRAERRARLEALTAGEAPCGGPDNQGAYCFGIYAAVGKLGTEAVALVDAEDPKRSSWCRYINHASREAHSANATPHVDADSRTIWFIAVRDIAAGEEICFDYGSYYHWDTPPV